ncbi:BRCA1-associated protein-like [Ostrea edulis]|uniref:BRCA1-associated protein-like n=1 Tax=Ostrea edulis TaxID=37623 RepID=UPI0024AFB083|nr:BRCA1-associated protein-like [Ostrea edulis]
MSESISLVVLRLEIERGYSLTTDLNYKAPDFEVLGEKETAKLKASYAEAACSSKKDILQDLLVKKCRGERIFTDLTIETYLNDMSEQAEKHSNLSTEKVSEETKRKNPEIGAFSREGSVASNASTSSGEKIVSKEVFFQPIDESDDRPNPGQRGERPHSGGRLRSSPRDSPTIQFFSGNPMVERTCGILHLYKDNKKTLLKEEVPRSELICMLAVPAAYTIHDLVKFTAPVVEGIEYMRIIRDTTPNQYMVLIKFCNQRLADEFFNTYNNVSFNSIEPDICQLIYVAKVEVMKDSEGACLPVTGLTELPNCPVCLDRMDESVDGTPVLTILCNHTFHVNCLAKWGDTSCPVCRYCQTPEETADQRCMTCGSQESLWICLVCGNIGCGRYVELHAYKHFQETQHTYAMQLGNNRVWDYVGDNFVHRLVQSKGDGKLVAVEDQQSSEMDGKVDALSLEYTYLLTSQLEQQRKYFEQKMTQVEKSAQERADILDVKYKTTIDDLEKVKIELHAVNREKQSVEKKCSHLHGRLTSALKDLQEEKQMNKCLLENQQVWQKKVTVLESQVHDLSQNKEQEIQELRDQLRDVMFYMGAQQKLSETSEVSETELQESQVIVGASGNTPSPRSKKGRKKDR